MRAALVLAAVLASAAPVAAACRLALAVGLDISGSVDAGEYRLQLDGLAGALTSPDVRKAFTAMPGAAVNLYVYEWSGPATQHVLVPWTTVDGDAALDAVAATLRQTLRRAGEPPTAVGQAMLFGATALARQSACWRQTLDLTGDGQSNIGPNPAVVRDSPALRDITVNALVIGADAPPFTDKRFSEIAELSSYFRAEVIRGPNAFVETAIGYEEFQASMARKLLRELQTLAVGDLGAPGRGAGNTTTAATVRPSLTPAGQ